MPNFLESLDRVVGEGEKPKPRPAGSYLASIQGVPAINKVGQDEHDVVDFRIRLVQPMDDVDRDSLAEHPPINEWSGVRDRHFVNSESAQYYFEQFMKKVLDFEGVPLRQALAQCPGKQYIVKMKQRPFINQQNEADIQFEVESRAHV